jgi:hypothetical protein
MRIGLIATPVFLVEKLRADGYSVLTAGTAEEAIELLALLDGSLSLTAVSEARCSASRWWRTMGCMFGVLPMKLLLCSPGVVVDDPARWDRAEAGLVDALRELPPWPRSIMQRGLLRANSVLVGAYVAPEHRACPLASAVWKTTGEEPASMYQVQLGLAELGLDSDQTSTFVAAFDEWAIASEYVRMDADGSKVLTHFGRSELLWRFENANQIDS